MLICLWISHLRSPFKDRSELVPSLCLCSFWDWFGILGFWFGIFCFWRFVLDLIGVNGEDLHERIVPRDDDGVRVEERLGIEIRWIRYSLLRLRVILLIPILSLGISCVGFIWADLNFISEGNLALWGLDLQSNPSVFFVFFFWFVVFFLGGHFDIEIWSID